MSLNHEGLPRYLLDSDPLAFEAALIPWVEHARAELRRLTSRSSRRHLSGRAHVALERELARQLAIASAQLLYEEFDRHRSRTPTEGRDSSSTAIFDGFIDELLRNGLAGLCVDYPEWAALVDTTLDRWIRTSAELLTRLEADLPELERAFGVGEPPLGEVVELETGLSDRHDGGRTVIGLVFSSGARVVYKPRVIAPEAAFFSLLSWLHGRLEGPDLIVPAILTRSGYGWMQRVPAEPCESNQDVHDYYRRAGALLAVLHMLGATDCHAGNLIAAGAHPVVIDLETLVQQQADSCEDAALLTVGLLPLWKRGLDGNRYDVGALTGSIGRDQDVTVWHFEAINTDTMEMSVAYRTVPSTESELWQGGRRVDAGAHVEDLISGFTAAYRTLMRERHSLVAAGGPLESFRRLRVRHIVRPTLLYAEYIYRSLSPALLRDGDLRRSALERFLEDDRSRQAVGDPTKWSAVARAERDALACLDVPRFTARADSRDLESASGIVARDYFDATGRDRLIRRLAEMNEERLGSAERLIRATLGLSRFRAFLPDS